MADTSMNFMDFLDKVYGKAAREQISAATQMSSDDLRKAADAFAPAFLQGLMQMSKFSNQGLAASDQQKTSSSLLESWPEDMRQAMQSLMEQGQKNTANFGASSSAQDPFSLFSSSLGQGPLEQLYNGFLAYSAQSQLCDQVAQATGLPKGQLQTLFPLFTAYGLMPLMPPKLDDAAGWVDYLGTMSRQNFQRANRELETMPSPLAAAFEGLHAGFFPQSEPLEAEPTALSDEEIAAQKMAELNEAAMEMQTNYMKGLNGLFESYQAGFDKARDQDK